MRNGNGRIVQYKDYVAGWLDSAIADFLEAIDDVPEGMQFALITSLDSNDDGAQLLEKSPELRTISDVARLVGAGILLPTKKLLEANAKSPIFFGFDEVWFFPSERIEPKPDSAWIVGPHRINQQKMRKFGPWLAKNHATLGLGDGDGLNIVAKIGGMAKHVIGHSLTQRQHAVST